jgi:hypothetical protein
MNWANGFQERSCGGTQEKTPCNNFEKLLHCLGWQVKNNVACELQELLEQSES